jgi:16S rRNA (uracil1498-N3)-methyltransferase
MTRRRWIADEVSADRAFLVGQNADHLARVLRARVGQEFEIATPTGVRLGEIVAIAPDRVEFATFPLPGQESPQSSAVIHLYLAVFKFDRFEWAVEKCTELGVAAITPVLAARTDAHLASAAGKRAERWRRIAHEASQQSRRDQPPAIHEPETLQEVLSEAPGKRIVLSENERERQLAELLEDSTEFSLAIGPEGGWTDSELTSFSQNGWSSASLGATILRAETAAVASTAVAVNFVSKTRHPADG